MKLRCPSCNARALKKAKSRDTWGCNSCKVYGMSRAEVQEHNAPKPASHKQPTYRGIPAGKIEVGRGYRWNVRKVSHERV